MATKARKKPALEIAGQCELQSGKTSPHDFESGLASEFTFVSGADGRADDDGRLIRFVYDRARNASGIVILNGQRIEAKPVARASAFRPACRKDSAAARCRTPERSSRVSSRLN